MYQCLFQLTSLDDKSIGRVPHRVVILDPISIWKLLSDVVEHKDVVTDKLPDADGVSESRTHMFRKKEQLYIDEPSLLSSSPHVRAHQ